MLSMSPNQRGNKLLLNPPLLELCWLFHFMTPVCLMPLAGSCRAGVKAGTGLRSLHLATLPISSQGPALRGAPPSDGYQAAFLPHLSFEPYLAQPRKVSSLFPCVNANRKVIPFPVSCITVVFLLTISQ